MNQYPAITLSAARILRLLQTRRDARPAPVPAAPADAPKPYPARSPQAEPDLLRATVLRLTREEGIEAAPPPHPLGWPTYEQPAVLPCTAPGPIPHIAPLPPGTTTGPGMCRYPTRSTR